MNTKSRLFGLVYALVLLAFTSFVLLDTFAISRVYRDATPTVTTPTISTSTFVPIITENSYQDENIKITITEQREYDTAIYIADIQLSSAEYLRTALAKNSYGRNVKQTTSDMAAAHNAILAVNGDYYGAREKGYVLRNGTLYREDGANDRQDLVIGGDGSFRIIQEKDISARQLLEEGAMQVLSFGPALVQHGDVCVNKNTEVGQASASNPRTAIAVVDELHYLLVVSDGRTNQSKGLSLYQLAHILKALGAKTAYNLDGGGSSTMWFQGRVINQPVNHGSKVSERKVSDIVYIGY